MLRAGEEAERGLWSAVDIPDEDGRDQAAAVAVTDAAVHQRALQRQRAALLHHGEDPARRQRGHRVAARRLPPASTRLTESIASRQE